MCCFEMDTRIDGLLEINSFTLGDLWLNNEGINFNGQKQIQINEAEN